MWQGDILIKKHVNTIRQYQNLISDIQEVCLSVATDKDCKIERLIKNAGLGREAC